MVLVNEKILVKTYPFDTDDTILARISSTLGSLPEHVILVDKDDNLLVESLKNKPENFNVNAYVLDEEARNAETFSDYFLITSSYFPNLSKEDYIKTFIFNNILIQEEPLLELQAESDIIDEFKNEGKDILDRISTNPREKEDYFIQKKNKLNVNKEKVTSFEKVFTSFVNTSMQKTTTPTVETVLLEFETDINNTIEGIFNEIHCNEIIPMCTAGDFLKYENSFIIPDFWRITIPDRMILHILLDKKPRTINKTNYDEAYALVFAYRENNIFKFAISINVQTQKIEETRDKVLRILKDTLTTKFTIKKETQKELTINVFIPNFKINYTLFQHLTMLNPSFNQFIAIDESGKTSKEKDYLYVYAKDPTDLSINPVNLTISNQVTERNVIDLKNEDKKDFPIGSNYVKLRFLHANDILSVQKIISIIQRLMTIYLKEETELVKFYRKYIPNFGESIVKGRKKKEAVSDAPLKEYALKDFYGDLFFPKYTKYCSNYPAILSEEEKNKREAEGFKIMKFPKTDDDGIQHYYSCHIYDKKYQTDPKKIGHIYPGLKENTLENRDKFPCVPCCYKRDQSKNPDSLYHTCGKEKESVGIKKTVSERKITTNKLLGFNKTGIVPPELNSILKDISEKYEYTRKGLSSIANSYLESILEVVDDVFDSMDENERMEYIVQERAELIKYAQIAYQNNPFAFDSIVEKLENINAYLSPKNFKELFERYYNIKTFVFTQNKDTKKVDLLVPDFSFIDIPVATNPEYGIIILEHEGAERDIPPHPVCESIIRNKIGKTDIYNAFKSTNALYDYLDEMFTNYVTFYRTDGSVYDYYQKLPIKVDKVSYDPEGHVRAIFTDYEGYLIPMLIAPAPSYGLRPISDEYKGVPFKIVQDFCTDNKLKINSISIEVGKDNGFTNVSVSNRKDDKIKIFTVFFEEEKNLWGKIPKQKYDFVGNSSELTLMRKMEQVAKILRVYFTKYYSKVSQDNDLEFSVKNLENFVKNFTTLEFFDYLSLTNVIDLDLVISKFSGKLPVINKDIQRALTFHTYQMMLYHLKKLENAFDAIFVEDFFENTSDFVQHKNNIILDNIDTYEKLINIRNNFYIHESPEFTDMSPFYFRNGKIMGGKILLAIPCSTMEEAIDVNFTYYNEGRISKDPTGFEDLKTNIYAFNSVSKVMLIKPDEDTRFNVLIYKKNDEKRYLALIYPE